MKKKSFYFIYLHLWSKFEQNRFSHLRENLILPPQAEEEEEQQQQFRRIFRFIKQQSGQFNDSHASDFFSR